MQTPSPRTERWRAAACVLLFAGAAQAHEIDADALPGAPGWRLGAAVAGVLPDADARWPAARLPGVLLRGSAPPDQRDGLRLEHATVDLGARLTRQLGAAVAVGWHDRDGAHVEAATLQARWPGETGELALRLGRDTVRLGAPIDGAGHFDRFSQTPLAKRAVFDDEWVDDGLALAWRAGDGDADGLRGVEAGLWRGRVFPGGEHGPLVPSLHLHAGWGHVDAHLSAARFQPDARGSAASTVVSSGHSHGTLDCRESLQQRVCFDGTVDVLAGSLQWEPDAGDWTVIVAALLRRERGQLYSASGDAAVHSRIAGGWADLVWRPLARWSLAGRLERLVPENRLNGVGTALLGGEAGVLESAASERATLAASYEAAPGLVLALETGRQWLPGEQVTHVALRLVWSRPQLLEGRW
ncbi:hypothetical protein [Rubrivivax gelatinosus]|uniref:hypothetical protein n=1 Tax=Rubrivivax gelatinosus TaxID=28068 RepID=UPI001F5B8235|nr:hypothetical protein [Rubrivivax gelatinosus]